MTAVTQLSNRSLRVFSKQFSIKIVKYEGGMLILGQNDIFCGHNIINFSVWFLPTDSLDVLTVASVTLKIKPKLINLMMPSLMSFFNYNILSTHHPCAALGSFYSLLFTSIHINYFYMVVLCGCHLICNLFHCAHLSTAVAIMTKIWCTLCRCFKQLIYVVLHGWWKVLFVEI